MTTAAVKATRSFEGLVLRAIIPASVLLLWGLGSSFRLWPTTIIASPVAVAVAGWRLTRSGSLLFNTWESMYRLIGGSLLGIVSGVATAAFVALSPRLGRLFKSSFDFLAPIPVLAWIPFFILFFGIDGARIALIAAGTGLIMYGATLTVVADTKAEYIELARLYRKNHMQVFFEISLPAGAWTMFGALRTALGLSWVLLLASELIASSSGLGWLIWDSRYFGRTDEMMAAMIWVGSLGFLLDRVVAMLQNHVTLWRPSFEGLS